MSQCPSSHNAVPFPYPRFPPTVRHRGPPSGVFRRHWSVLWPRGAAVASGGGGVQQSVESRPAESSSTARWARIAAMSAVSRVSRHFHVTRAGGSLTSDGVVLRWLPLNSSEGSTSTAMPSVVKKEVKTFTKPDPDVSTFSGITNEGAAECSNTPTQRLWRLLHGTVALNHAEYIYTV